MFKAFAEHETGSKSQPTALRVEKLSLQSRVIGRVRLGPSFNGTLVALPDLVAELLKHGKLSKTPLNKPGLLNISLPAEKFHVGPSTAAGTDAPSPGAFALPGPGP
jgi:hypothetical protein